MSDGSGTVVNVLITDEQKPTGRRSGNYKPSIWDFNFIQSLNNPHVGEEYVKRGAERKEQVKKLLEWNNEREPSYYFELIDDLQRLGLLYLFQTQVKLVLANLYNKIGNQTQPKDDLYTAALKFRLFRQYGFHISQGD
ncbi:hypothetical protein LIER_36595 [Lithospermum erythrorhizon]|uniref:Terpene synthase N-terminal domain-containing protein n=1 Tax=Lithospermum erythrorhizon TaxID=34254 RepID=A0AAV3P824_LITER